MKAKEQDPLKRQAWWDQVQALDVTQMVFLDECGVNTTRHRRFGRSPNWPLTQRHTLPKCCAAQLEELHHHLVGVVALGALSLQGVQAVMSLEGATDRLAFEAFIEQVLLPTLVPGQIVVMDNLSAHKRLKAQKMVEAAGCGWLFLPPYSPDFNPIEMLYRNVVSKCCGASSKAT